MEFTRSAETLRGDFWGWGKFAPTEGRVIVNKDVRLARADATSAEIAVDNDWVIGNQTVMREATTIRAGEDQGARVLDLTYRFTSDYDVKLNRMAFTGVCFRCRKEGPYTFADSKGRSRCRIPTRRNRRSDWPARDWYSHTSRSPAARLVASALIDHPSNPPSLWHGARLVSFLNPASRHRRRDIPAGRTLTLRYRAVAHEAGSPRECSIGWRPTGGAAYANAEC